MKKISYILITLIILIAGSLIIILCFFARASINAELTGYNRENLYPDALYEYEGYIYYNMTEAEALDMIHNPDCYTAYQVDVKINNNNSFKIHNVRAKLSNDYNGIWFQRTGMTEWTLDLEPLQEYKGSVSLIVRTDQLSYAEVDELIKSISIAVSYSKSNNFPFSLTRNTTVAKFEIE